ncbi:hypothetical protein [Bradyrhizobium sp. Ash2021]|uniref:hypothetical protein n=1 Tax=Bradyrhizobium sp. Ash2021 TaxID=2954771 RepID=UPI0028161CCE|nr:hypothetical protein [Bradyrhizobium sp. Ash2021]WMT76304.1 hypothetical protein NL528_08015 [Bradyrhizobium sp. Ash2021]
MPAAGRPVPYWRLRPLLRPLLTEDPAPAAGPAGRAKFQGAALFSKNSIFQGFNLQGFVLQGFEIWRVFKDSFFKDSISRIRIPEIFLRKLVLPDGAADVQRHGQAPGLGGHDRHAVHALFSKKFDFSRIQSSRIRSSRIRNLARFQGFIFQGLDFKDSNSRNFSQCLSENMLNHRNHL